MGIKVTGNAQYTADRPIQLPIEDLYPYFKEAFDKGLLAVSWTQYTPGFNDGDPCEFTVGEVRGTANEEIARAWVEEDTPDLELAYGPQAPYYDVYEYGYYGDHPDGKEFGDVVNSIPVEKGSFEDALRSTFGNYTEIVVTPTQVVQYDYDCGY
jgi:hypothetical protein